jgi:hypothetical protein
LAEEVNDVSILFSNHGIRRRRGGFYPRSSSIGGESFSQKEKNGAEEIIPHLNNKEK